MSLETTEFIIHPDFSETNDGADIALLILKTDLPEDVEILKLPSSEMLFSKIIAAGFGKNDGRKISGSGMGVLRTTELELYQFGFQAPLFSVKQLDGKGACDGDSGGPAMIENGHDVFVVGVFEKTAQPASDDPDRNTCSYLGYYVNVQFHLPWIVKELDRTRP